MSRFIQSTTSSLGKIRKSFPLKVKTTKKNIRNFSSAQLNISTKTRQVFQVYRYPKVWSMLRFATAVPTFKCQLILLKITLFLYDDNAINLNLKNQKDKFFKYPFINIHVGIFPLYFRSLLAVINSS